jgi:uncharacterized phage protein (TIGR01671 family)
MGNSKVLKFRAWDKGINNWHIFISVKSIMCEPNTIYELDSSDGLIIWEQYTGLKDKNEKDIYEGDIVRSDWDGLFGIIMFGNYENSYEDTKSTNVGFYWGDTNSCMFGLDCEGKTDKYEIIGNIHENSDLIEENK